MTANNFGERLGLSKLHKIYAQHSLCHIVGQHENIAFCPRRHKHSPVDEHALVECFMI